MGVGVLVKPICAGVLGNYRGVLGNFQPLTE